jgi:hypothetical protein
MQDTKVDLLIHTRATSTVRAIGITNFLVVLLNNRRATVAPADTMNACPEGKANAESAAIKKSDFGIRGLGLATASFTITPIGIRTIIDIAITVAAFLPVQPANTNKSIMAAD